MSLGEKTYNYDYYGLPISRQWKNNDDTAPFAALVRPNIWGYQPTGIYYDDGQYSNADKNGKPLDDTIAVWRLPKNASFACNAFFSVDISSTLGVHYDVNVENSNVPLLCAAIDTTSSNWGKFDRKCVERYAYDTVNTCNGPKSVLAYDINPAALCYNVFVLVYDRNTPANAPSTRSLAGLASYIGTGSNYDVCIIRPEMYRGTGATRIYTAETIPEFEAPYFDGVLLADTSSNIPIPEGQTYLKSLIADTAGGHNYRNDVIYRPFVTRYNANLYSGANDNNYQYQMSIGFTAAYTKSQIVAGAGTIDPGHTITGRVYRCNYDVKVFDDVVYQWENVAYDVTTGVSLQNGFNLSALSNSDSIRFYTRIRIIDAKGNTRGKALELAVKHEVAYIGFYFADNATRAASAVLGSTGDGVGVYLPEKIGGVTTGRYFTGEEIKNVPYADADSASAFPYEPETTGSDSGDLDTHLKTGTIASGVSWFGATDIALNLLSNWLNKTYKPDNNDLVEDFKGVNPADYIVSIMYFPAGVPQTATTAPFTIGGLLVEHNNISTSVHILDKDYGEGSKSFYDLGSFALQPPYIFGDFRDTYIKLLLYIPWCGFVTLDPALFCQSPDGTYHTIRAALSIDYKTGNCLGLIYRDRRLIDTVNGTCGVSVPMSAIAQGNYQNAIKQTEIALKNAKAQQLSAFLGTAGAIGGAMVSAATGNVLGVAAGAIAAVSGAVRQETAENNVEGIQYQLTHTAPSIGDISSASPFNNALSEQAARIFIFKPAMLPTYDAAAYGRTTGYACCKQGTLSQFSGFTVCADVDLSGFDAPAHHKAAIKQALQKGVYL